VRLHGSAAPLAQQRPQHGSCHHVEHAEAGEQWVITQRVGELSQYFLVFVLIAQIFAKVPALNTLEPATRQAAFGIAQVVTLLAFVVAAIWATRALRARRLVAAVPPERI